MKPTKDKKEVLLVAYVFVGKSVDKNETRKGSQQDGVYGKEEERQEGTEEKVFRKGFITSDTTKTGENSGLYSIRLLKCTKGRRKSCVLMKGR